MPLQKCGTMQLCKSEFVKCHTGIFPLNLCVYILIYIVSIKWCQIYIHHFIDKYIYQINIYIYQIINNCNSLTVLIILFDIPIRNIVYNN